MIGAKEGHAVVVTEEQGEVPVPGPESEDFVIRSFEDAVAWMRYQNPNTAINRPQDVDWQALKKQGRRY